MDGAGWLELIGGLLGGLALFLFGLERLTGALKLAAGDRLKQVLERLAGNRYSALLTGAAATALLQSSSLTTVLAVGFVAGGLMTLQQSIGVIIGSNIGTTVTGQLVAFKLTEVALLLVALGFALLMLGRGNVKHSGAVLLGLGLLFHGMELIGAAVAPLRDNPAFTEAMLRLEHPLAAIALGALFTALVQSSSATNGLVITLASQGLITLPAGIALALGANVGTTITSQIAALGRSRDALRAALVHLLFNLSGALLLVWFIPQFAELVRALSPQAPELTGTARLAAEAPRQIANANTLFNSLMAVLFIGFTPQLAALVRRLLPERERPSEPARVAAEHLRAEYLESPALALDMLRREVVRLGELAVRMLAAYGGTRRLSAAEGTELARQAAELREACASYAGQLSSRELVDAHSSELLRLMTAANDLENACSLLGRRLAGSHGETVVNAPTDGPGGELHRLLGELHAVVTEALELTLRALAARDAAAQHAVLERRARVEQLEAQAALAEARAFAQLAAVAQPRATDLRHDSGRLDALPRLYHFCRRAALQAVATEPGTRT